MASRTRRRVPEATLGWALITRDTVWCDTPARVATSAFPGGRVVIPSDRTSVPRHGSGEPTASAEGDLAAQQAGSGAPLVGGQRLGLLQRGLEPGLELRRGSGPVRGRGVGRQVPHRDDEAVRAEGAGVPG